MSDLEPLVVVLNSLAYYSGLRVAVSRLRLLREELSYGS